MYFACSSGEAAQAEAFQEEEEKDLSQTLLAVRLVQLC